MSTHYLHYNVQLEPITLRKHHNDIIEITNYRGSIDAFYCVHIFLNFIDWIIKSSIQDLCINIYLTENLLFFCLYTLHANNRIMYFHMKADPRKCHFILSSNKQKEFRFLNTSIVSSLSKKLLGITFDSELKFEEHINKICNIVNKKLNALHHIYIIISA